MSLSPALVYLSDYCDTLDSLPVELSRNYTKLKELDATTYGRTFGFNFIGKETSKDLKKSVETFLKEASKLSQKEKTSTLQHINQLCKQHLKQGQDKVALATLTHEMVDRHVKRLDEDLAKFEEEQLTGIKSHANQSSLGHQDKGRRRAAVSSQVVSNGGYEREEDPVFQQDVGRSSSNNNRVSSTRRPRTVRRTVPDAPNEQEAEDSPFVAEEVSPPSPPPVAKEEQEEEPVKEPEESVPENPEQNEHAENEPTYCICSQVSFACDNENCPIEWFHYTCVGLDGPVKGKWYCPSCQNSKNIVDK